MRVVLVNGCFDLLHPGHVAHLQEARLMGDRLLVGLTMDEHVGKHGRPIQKWSQREYMLRALAVVDGVFPCKSGWDAIRHVTPQVFVKGPDYSGDVDYNPYHKLDFREVSVCEEIGCEIRFTKSLAGSTTELIERVRACST